MKIAIFSRGSQLYSTQSLLEAGLGRGHEMFVLDHLQCSLLVENGSPKILYNGGELPLLDAVIPRIGATVTAEGISLLRQLEILGVCSLVTASALALTRNKLHCLQLLAGEKIPVPRTCLPAQPEHLPKIIAEMGGAPVILKLLDGTHGVGVILAESEQSAVSVGETFFKMNQKFLVQEFIREASGTDVRAFVVGGQIVASMKRQAPEGEFRSNLHRGASAIPVALTGEEEMLVRKTVKVLQLEVAGVDILRSENGPLIMEVNASPGLEGIETTTKVDIAWEIILHVEKMVRKRS